MKSLVLRNQQGILTLTPTTSTLGLRYAVILVLVEFIRTISFILASIPSYMHSLGLNDTFPLKNSPTYIELGSNYVKHSDSFILIHLLPFTRAYSLPFTRANSLPFT